MLWLITTSVLVLCYSSVCPPFTMPKQNSVAAPADGSAAPSASRASRQRTRGRLTSPKMAFSMDTPTQPDSILFYSKQIQSTEDETLPLTFLQ